VDFQGCFPQYGATVMTAKATIISAINAKIGMYPTQWRIGITRNIAERKQYWSSQGSISGWGSWEADLLQDAQDIESWGINTKRMKGGTGGDMSGRGTVHVYIFKP
jgi:hypothetical protein